MSDFEDDYYYDDYWFYDEEWDYNYTPYGPDEIYFNDEDCYYDWDEEDIWYDDSDLLGGF